MFFPSFRTTFKGLPATVYSDIDLQQFNYFEGASTVQEKLAEFEHRCSLVREDRDNFLIIYVWVNDKLEWRADIWLFSALATYGSCGPAFTILPYDMESGVYTELRDYHGCRLTGTVNGREMERLHICMFADKSDEEIADYLRDPEQWQPDLERFLDSTNRPSLPSWTTRPSW